MDCTIYKTADMIGKRWTLIILLQLYKGRSRYNQIKNSIKGITPKILSLRLKEMENEGLIRKDIDPSSSPISCTYSLTPAGNNLIKIIKNLKHWALRWKINNKTCEHSDCKRCTL